MSLASSLIRVSSAIEHCDPIRKLAIDEASRIDFETHFAMQTVQSVAFAMGEIEIEISQFLYSTLGNSSESFNRKPLADRVLTLALIADLTK